MANIFGNIFSDSPEEIKRKEIEAERRNMIEEMKTLAYKNALESIRTQPQFLESERRTTVPQYELLSPEIKRQKIAEMKAKVEEAQRLKQIRDIVEPEQNKQFITKNVPFAGRPPEISTEQMANNLGYKPLQDVSIPEVKEPTEEEIKSILSNRGIVPELSQSEQLAYVKGIAKPQKEKVYFDRKTGEISSEPLDGADIAYIDKDKAEAYNNQRAIADIQAGREVPVKTQAEALATGKTQRGTVIIPPTAQEQKFESNKKMIANSFNTFGKILQSIPRYESSEEAMAKGLLATGEAKTGIKVSLSAPELTRIRVFNAQRDALKGQIARAISSEVGVLTNQDIERASGIVPNVTDDIATQDFKMSVIGALGSAKSQEEASRLVDEALSKIVVNKPNKKSLGQEQEYDFINGKLIPRK